MASASFWKAVSPCDAIFAGTAPMENELMGLRATRAGKTVTLFWNLVRNDPPPPGPYTPTAAPQITIFDATGVAQVAAQAMTAVMGFSSLYKYEFVTPASPTLAQLGTWTAWVDFLDAAGNPVGSAYQGGGSVTPAGPAGPAKATPVFQLV